MIETDRDLVSMLPIYLILYGQTLSHFYNVLGKSFLRSFWKGGRPWEGARRLSDMVQEVSKEAKRWFQDHGMNLIDMKEREEPIFHDEEVELVVSLCRKLLKKEYESIARDSRYKKVSKRLTDVITAFLQDRELKERVKEEKEEVNMCDVVGDCMRLGEKKGLLEGEKKGERKEKLFIAKNMLKEGFSLSQIQRITGLKLQEIEKLKERM